MVNDSTQVDDSRSDTRRHWLRLVWVRWLLGIGIMVLLFILFVPVFFSVGMWDGRFPVCLDVRSKSNAPIQDVSYMTFFDHDTAQSVMEEKVSSSELEFQPNRREEGKWIADVPCSGKTWIFNIELNRVEAKYIMLRIVYEDDTKHRMLVEIPPGRGQRSIVVEIP